MTKSLGSLLRLLPAFLITSCLSAQTPATFIVIKASNNIYSGTLKRELKTGDAINTSDKLSFNSKESYLRVINPKDGQKTLRNVPDNSPRELMQLFEKFADEKRQGSKSRGGNAQYMDNLADRLSRDKILILGNGWVSIDTSKMSLKKPSGIKAMYEIDGKKFEKVVSDQRGFGLGRDQLLGSPKPSLLPRIRLYYFEDLNDPVFTQFFPIGSFTPLYADELTLAIEVKAIVNAFSPSPSNQSLVFHEIMNYLASEYADPIEENLKEWLEVQKILK